MFFLWCWTIVCFFFYLMIFSSSPKLCRNTFSNSCSFSTSWTSSLSNMNFIHLQSPSLVMQFLLNRWRRTLGMSKHLLIGPSLIFSNSQRFLEFANFNRCIIHNFSTISGPHSQSVPLLASSRRWQHSQHCSTWSDTPELPYRRIPIQRFHFLWSPMCTKWTSPFLLL